MEIYCLLEEHFLVQSDCTFLLVLSSLSRIFATRNSAVNAENFAGTTRPTSLFLFLFDPVTRAQSLFVCFVRWLMTMPYSTVT